MTSYAFATIATNDGDRATVVVDGRHYRLDRLLKGGPVGGLRLWLDRWEELLERIDPLVETLGIDGAAHPAAVDNPKLLAPIRFPNKMVCVGGVYADHVAQFGLEPRRADRMPMFLRPPTTSIVGPEDLIRIPPTSTQFDWEIELAVVVYKRLSFADEAEALDAIAGYSVGIDFSVRNLLKSELGLDSVRAKAQDGMAPLGPVLTPARFVEDPQNIGLRLWVNDKLRQDGTTAKMMYSIAEQISTISRYITLEPGDVVFTGSPAGSATGDGDYLKPGDTVRAQIDQVGALDLVIAASVMEDVEAL
jgi:2-keto-4-pentenoate hydratase/2-oxohepta-3-ene-1,7-dioic acid hydratase in catechol pathway